jgi:hypothetical protein
MTAYWKAAATGDFGTSGNWTPFGPPGPLDQAMLTASGSPYTVNVTSDQTVLTVDTSADATLDLQSNTFTAEAGTGSGANNGTIEIDTGSLFAVAGTINNNGLIELQGSGAGTAIALLGDTTLNGGALTMSDNFGAHAIAGGGTLTNAGDSDVSGAGLIEVPVNNKATVLPSGNIIPVIDATGSNAPLELDGTVTNTGELLGDGSAGLDLDNAVYNVGGLVDANTGLVELDSTIIGGTIENASGTFLVMGGSFDGGGTHPITVIGPISVDTGQNLYAQGAFKTNDGTLALESNSFLLLGLSNVAAVDTTFSGGGQIVLSDATIDLNPSTHVGSVPPKLNNVDNIIIGTGTIGNAATPGSIVLNNETKGLVEALNGILTIYSNVTNAGVLDSTNGTLSLVGNVVTNTGSLKAEVGANILLLNTTIHGGTLTGGGGFDADGAVLDGSASMLTNAGAIQVQTLLGKTSILTLEGTINNTGTMELLPSVSSGSDDIDGVLNFVPIGSDLVIGAAGKTQVTLKGTGTITLDAYGDDYIIGDANFPGGVPTTLNNASNIEGTGRIGDDGLTLKDSGSIEATFAPLVIDTGGRTVTNTGTLEGALFGVLYIDSPLNNTGGHLLTNHGDLVAAEGATGGTATIVSQTSIEFGGPTTTAVQFSSGVSGSGLLILDDSVHFKGVISGFAKFNINDSIDLNDIDAGTVQKVSYTGGVLTLKDGLGHTAQLHFSGTYTLASFNIAPDGHGGTLLTDPPVAPHAPPVAPHANPSLFANYIAAAFPTVGEALGGLLAKHETVAPPLLALPNG